VSYTVDSAVSRRAVTSTPRWPGEPRRCLPRTRSLKVGKRNGSCLRRRSEWLITRNLAHDDRSVLIDRWDGYSRATKRNTPRIYNPMRRRSRSPVHAALSKAVMTRPCGNRSLSRHSYATLRSALIADIVYGAAFQCVGSYSPHRRLRMSRNSPLAAISLRLQLPTFTQRLFS